MTRTQPTRGPWTVEALVAVGFTPGDPRRPAPRLPLVEAGLLVKVERVRRVSQLRPPTRFGGVPRSVSNERGP